MAVTQASGGAGTVPPRTVDNSDHGNITAPDAGDLNTAARDYCVSQGWAMQGGGYPIRPVNNHGAADLDKAIHAVGRGGASGNTIRKYIIGRAHTLGLVDEIPTTWSAGGALVSPSTDGGMRSIDTGVERIQYRFAADLELRAGGDGRTIVGIAVPYNQPQRIDNELVEQFDGSASGGPFDHQMRAMHRVGYWNLHSVHGGTEVGHIKYARNDAAGLYTESFVSPDDPDGDRTLDEIRSGLKPQQSVGFDTGPGGTQHRSGVAHRVRADLTELAAVPKGAYGAGAAVMAVRAAHGDGRCPECGHSQAQDRVAELRVLAAGIHSLPSQYSA